MNRDSSATNGAVRWSRRDLALANAALAGAIFLWGSFYSSVEELLQTWDIFSATAGRTVLGTAILLLALLLREGPRAFSPTQPWRRIVLLGGVGFGLFCIFITIGIGNAGTIASAFVATTTPIVTAFMARLILKQRLRPQTLIGAALALAGGVLMALKGGVVEFHGGEILVFTAAVCFAWYSIMVPRWLPGYSQLSIAALTVGSGTMFTVLFWVFAWLFQVTEIRYEFSPRSIGLLVYIAVASICLAVMFWNYGVVRLGAPVASLYSNLAPVFAALVAMVFGIYPTMMQILGGAIILSGVIVAQHRRVERPG
ncbi:MAG: DMT family transporter [Alphaproteobacteria bacterium]